MKHIISSLFVLCLFGLSSCQESTLTPDSVEEKPLTIQGTVENMTAAGLPEGTRAFVMWDGRVDGYGDVLILGQELTLNTQTGEYLGTFDGSLPKMFARPASEMMDTMGVGYIVLINAPDLQTGDFTENDNEWESSIIGALDNHAIVYKRGETADTPQTWLKDFPDGFSLGVTVHLKPDAKDQLRPVDAPLESIKVTDDYYFADWH